MVCQVQYGGRITQQMDRDLFDSYGEHYINQSIVGNGHVYVDTATQNPVREGFKYRMLNDTSIENYIKHIDEIPSSDDPEVFGLHANSDLNFRLKESIEMIDTIIDSRSKDCCSSGSKTREQLV